MTAPPYTKLRNRGETPDAVSCSHEAGVISDTEEAIWHGRPDAASQSS